MARPAMTQEKQKRILYVLGALVGGVVWLNFLLIPQMSRWSQQGQEARRLGEKVTQARRLLLQLPAVEQSAQRLKSQVAIRPVGIPTQEQLPELMDAIAQVARASRVRVVALRPTLELSKIKPGASGYMEVPIQMEAFAGYHQVGAFLDALESSENLLRVREMDIAHEGDELLTHRVVITLQAYLAPPNGGSS